MKNLNWTHNSETHAYMKQRQSENRGIAKFNANENWMGAKLGCRWSRQAIWGLRLFDFWNPVLGIAIEVDGMEHDCRYDAYRDEYNFRRSAIVVLRVRNRNESDACRALQFVESADNWCIRREKLGIAGKSKASCRSLVNLPYPPSLLQQFLEKGVLQLPQIQII